MRIASPQQLRNTNMAEIMRIMQNAMGDAQQTQPVVTLAPRTTSTLSYDSLNVNGYMPVLLQTAQGIAGASPKLSVEDALARIKTEGEAVDRSGMSDKEVMEELYSRYEKYLGKEQWPLISYYIHTNHDDHNKIVGEFNGELISLTAKGWTVERHRAAYAEMHGYEGMTQEEMQQAIADKYNKMGMTPKNFLAMMTEMRFSGAMDSRECSRIANSVSSSIETHVWNDYIKQGYSFDEIHNEYYEKYFQSVQIAMNRPMSLSAIYDDQIFRMTKGGEMPASMETLIHNFFNKTLVYSKTIMPDFLITTGYS